MTRFATLAAVLLALAAPAFAQSSPEPFLEKGKHLLYGEDFTQAKDAFHQAALRSNLEHAPTARALSQIAADCAASESAAKTVDWDAFKDTLDGLDMARVDPHLHDWIKDRKAEVESQRAARRVVREVLRMLDVVVLPALL